MNLSDINLRPRDIRRAVEPDLYRIEWDSGTHRTSEWVTVSTETEFDISKLDTWLLNERTTFSSVLAELGKYFADESFYLVSAQKKWLINYDCIGIVRFATSRTTILLSIKFEVRHFLQMRMNILQWCSIPKSFMWARV
ncbi:hypothetical protein [Vibrio gallaecicus]|uniref:hypothetical protein n=1 Tax=Vibrio gallaecicus TaxID=552386 RepID=UPI0025B4EE97|nr:hypothetical protein [Vibrio gallaecicus]MDN3616887.1 hypothetical protein [Vibrio gallaecicus]